MGRCPISTEAEDDARRVRSSNLRTGSGQLPPPPVPPPQLPKAVGNATVCSVCCGTSSKVAVSVRKSPTSGPGTPSSTASSPALPPPPFVVLKAWRPREAPAELPLTLAVVGSTNIACHRRCRHAAHTEHAEGPATLLVSLLLLLLLLLFVPSPLFNPAELLRWRKLVVLLLLWSAVVEAGVIPSRSAGIRFEWKIGGLLLKKTVK